MCFMGCTTAFPPESYEFSSASVFQEIAVGQPLNRGCVVFSFMPGVALGYAEGNPVGLKSRSNGRFELLLIRSKKCIACLLIRSKKCRRMELFGRKSVNLPTNKRKKRCLEEKLNRF